MMPLHPPEKSQTQCFEEDIELVVRADELGFKEAWIGQHHTLAWEPIPANDVFIAHVLSLTKRIRLGTGVSIVTQHHPVNVAVRLAFLDHLAHGRFSCGFGQGGVPTDWGLFDLPDPKTQGLMTIEAIDMILKLWQAEAPFAFKGKYWHIQLEHPNREHGIGVLLKPYQKPHPPIRVAANSPDTFPAMGDQGYPIFVAVRVGTLSELVPNIQAYREAYKAAGHPGEGQVFLRVPVYVGDTYEQAIAEPEPSIMHFYRYLGERLEDSATRAGARAIEQRAERGQRLQAITYDEARRDKIIVGTPEMVVDRLQALQEELGLDGILAELNCGSLIPHERVMNSMRLLCEKVMPRFK
jgi:alkanesulfonate monooxygenase SsuD/methylene tetrahydromethanopterin reductase-like flavin-dependent oxidoreductase (luciferase family)